MNTKLIIAIVAVVLVAGGGWFYWSSQKSGDSNKNQTTNSKQTKTSSKPESQTSTLSRLLKSGRATKCTFKSQEISGTVYIAGKNRAAYQFNSTDPEIGSGGMILSENTMFIWRDKTKDGIKKTFSPEELESAKKTAGSSSESASSVDWDKEYNFSCTSWRVNNSLFTPPSDVKFTDMQQMMQSMQQ